ncbi:MAG: aminodeoxychorismate synthase component I [Pseudomonadota bacterium]
MPVADTPIELPYQRDALASIDALRGLPHRVLLHSADTSDPRFGRYDVVSAVPDACYSYDGQAVAVDGKPVTSVKNATEALTWLQQRSLPLAQRRATNSTDTPFSSGLIGYLGFPLHLGLERQAPAPSDPTGLPQLWFGDYRWALVTDHQQRWTRLVGAPPATLALDRRLSQPARAESPAAPEFRWCSDFKPSMDRASYCRAFDRIRDYTTRGDCYQINFARHFEARYRGEPLQLYRQWLRAQAAPFGAFIEVAPQQAVLSLSPERFLRITPDRAGGQRLEAAPIKGTRPRGVDHSDDQRQKLALLASEKDRAENLMIVDLLRNDLGRIAEVGSIVVTRLCEPQAFTNVHHLVSNIQGQLRSSLTSLEALAALFPSGSVTGAPKIRAIDIINELEPVGRSVYCGAIGYLCDSGNVDTSVAIRSAVADRGQLHVWGGGGLVLDSDLERELAEISHKIGAFLNQA